MPDKLKIEAESLVKKGFYSSFSDVVRDSLRRLVAGNKYDRWLAEAKDDFKKGRATVLRNDEDVDKYMNSIR